MNYIVLIRGINISGRNKVSMSELKKELIDKSFDDVKTYLNSGNIRLSSDKDEKSIKNIIQNILKDSFNIDTSCFVIKEDLLKEYLGHAPAWWGNEDKNIYDNLIFIISSASAEEIALEIGPVSKDIETVEIYKDVIFWSFDLSKYQKCNWWKKTASKGIAEKLTIRTAKTLKKIMGMD